MNPTTPVQINIVHSLRKCSSLKGIIVIKYIFASPQFCHVWVILLALGRKSHNLSSMGAEKVVKIFLKKRKVKHYLLDP